MSDPPTYDFKQEPAAGYSGQGEASPPASYPQVGQPQQPMAYPQGPQYPQGGMQYAPSPQVTVQNVQVNLQQQQTTRRREWSSGICSCFDDIGGCCYTYFCFTAMGCNVARRLGEPECCVGCCCLPYGSLSHMRTKLRTMYNIHGDICKDMVTSWFFGSCLMCQMDRELKHVGL